MHSSKLSYVFILSALAIVLFASSGLAEHVIALTPEHVLTHANNHHHSDKQTPLAPPPSIIDPSVDGETRTLEQKIWETSTFSLEELMSGAVQLLASVIDYVAKHPEVAALILLTLLVPLALGGFGVAAAGCGDDNGDSEDVENAAEDAVDEGEDAAGEVGDAADEATDDAGDALDDDGGDDSGSNGGGSDDNGY